MKRKRKRLVPGDIFLVPMGDGTFVAGRLAPETGRAVFFRDLHTSAPEISLLLRLGTFEIDGHIDLDPLEEERWPVIGRIPWRDGEFAFGRMLVGSNVACATGPLDRFTDISSVLRPIEGDEWRSLQKLSVWNEAGVVEVVRRAIAAHPEPSKR
jgi:hypothetical protein